MFFAQFYEELNEGEDEQVDEDVMTRAEGEDEESEQSINIKELTTEEIQSAIDRLKKGKAKDSSGVRAERSKIAVTRRKRKSGQSSTKLRNRKTLHQKAGEKSEYRFSTQKATERMRATTGQYAGYKYCTSDLQLYFMLDSHPAHTEYSLLTRRGFGPTTDARITLWCTGCWSNVDVSGVYHCTSARSTSQKHLIVSNILHCGSR